MMLGFRKLFLGLGVTVAAIASMSPIGHAEQGVTQNEILLGAFGPITGPLSYIGIGARAGMTLAVSEINEHGGINGRKIKLDFQTSGSEPAEFLAAAQKLIESDKVFALMIASGSVGAAAAADTIREKGIVSY